MQGQFGLADVWYLLLALVLYLYLVSDGFDLGVGILCLFTRDEDRRGAMMAAIEGVWHANQTWLVILGGLLFGAFPAVYGTVLSALYLPAGLLLLALMARGVGLEYRPHARSKPTFSRLFAWGSLATALAEGCLLGGVLQGITSAGALFSWLTPFAVVLALTLAAVYAMLGAAWLTMQTGGEAQLSAKLGGIAAATAALAGLVALTVVIAISGVLGHLVGWAAGKWLSPLSFVFFLLAVVNIGLYARALGKGWERRPLMHAAVMVLLLCLAVGANLYPLILPPDLTVEKAAAPPAMLRIMLWVNGLLLPLILVYNAYQYRVFAGRSALDGSPGDSGPEQP